MGIPGWGQILLVVLLIVLLFGRGKISDLMGDVAKGIRSFKDGLKDDPDAQAQDDEALEAIAPEALTDDAKTAETVKEKETASS